MKKVVIVGAGPAGMFAAKELVDDAFDITVIDKSNRVGGAGLHIDGKFNFHPTIGGDLTEFVTKDEAWGIIDGIDKTFQKYGEPDNYYDEEKLEELGRIATRAGIDFIKIKQKHIGSDRLPEVMEKFKLDLEGKGVKFKLCSEVKNLEVKNNLVEKVVTDEERLACDSVIIAPGRSTPGRSGQDWFKKLCDRLKIKVKFNPLDVGVRVEVKNEVMHDIVNKYNCHDPKFYIQTHHYDDRVRTFCICYGGYVTRDKYGDGVYGVNGHSYSKFGKQSENTNFAFLVTTELTHPQEDTEEYGTHLGRLANCLSGGSPIIQRVKDLRKGKRSTWDSINKAYVKPTLRDCVPGDITMALTGRITRNLIEGLEKLDNVIPGVWTGSTLLYAPEIKFYARRVVTDKHLRTMIKNLYVAGDGAGLTRGIVQSGATGVIA
ncbi:MAG TPA: NAD(P)/FAD-dependent oxidoreductase, partial [archaeon]|nr:NAD(P)/FAD-dependent oxidoreductase [archaeon]